jgi:hypothetical protein
MHTVSHANVCSHVTHVYNCNEIYEGAENIWGPTNEDCHVSLRRFY